jgi:hypothetical protein
MKVRLIAAAATLAILPAFAQVSGSYDVTGKDVDGKPYKGKLSASKSGQTLKLRYSSGKSYNGVGIEKGSLLFSAWGPSDKCGMGVYEIKDGAAGDGMYADIGHPQVGKEVLKRTAGSGEVNGTYEIAGKDFDGVPFAGLVKVEPRGPVYKLSFKTAGEEYDGIGMTFANHLVVGWGGKGCAVAAYEMKADNTGTGKYAEFGVGKLGEETLMKSF